MRLLCFLTLAAVLSAPAFANTILFGGNGGHPNPDGSPLSINNGWLVIVDQTTGNVTTVGHPAGIQKISGLAFDNTGALWANSLTAGGFPPPLPSSPTSDLLLLNPNNGALISDIGHITLNGSSLQIADLAVQPGTNNLFGVGASSSGDAGLAGNLYTINKATGVATLVGNTGDFFNAIAFGPTGILYATTADLDMMGNIINNRLRILNPANAQTISSVAIAQDPGALAVRSDGVIFEGNGDAGGIYTINATTGAETPVGNTGLNFVGDLAFQAVPEPSTLALFGLALLVVLCHKLSGVTWRRHSCLLRPDSSGPFSSAARQGSR